jgi:transglutaminase-like putative cysteine protease
MALFQPAVVGGGKALVTDFRARTIHPDGTVVPFEGKIDDLIKSEPTSQNRNRSVIHLPGVETGSVIEYRYAERYDGLYSSPFWEIQRDYPVRKAHFTFLPFKTFRPGSENKAGSYLIDRRGVPLNFLLYWPKLPAGSELKRDGQGRFYLDVADVPAAAQTEWMPPNDSLRYRVRFYYRSDSDSKDFWNKEAKRWSKDVDRLAEPTKTIHDAVAGIVAAGDSELDKAKKLYKAVQALNNTDFAGPGAPASSTSAEKRAEETWNQKGGSSQDIAILYLAMVRAAGLTAYDMKVVNRDRSTFAPDYLNFNQLDDDIILVSIQGKEIALDPGQKMCPFQVVAWKHTGAGGIRESADGKAGVTSALQPYTANTVLRMGDVTVDDHGGVQGSFRFVITGQVALHWRQAALQNSDADVKREFDQWLESTAPQGVEAHLDRFEGLSDPDTNLVGIVSVKGSLAASNSAAVQLPCFFFETRAHEPFVEDSQRTVPVDMHYGEQVTDQVTYHLPAGMQAEGAPQDARIPWQENALFAIKSKASAGQITIARSLARSFTFAKPDEYEGLRSFYQKVDAADQQHLVLTSAHASQIN